MLSASLYRRSDILVSSSESRWLLSQDKVDHRLRACMAYL